MKEIQHGGKLEEMIWDEFNRNWDELACQSEIALAELRRRKEADLLKGFEKELPPGDGRKAFDKSLLSITDNYRVLLSNTLKEISNVVLVQRGFIVYQGQSNNIAG